ncbi:MAG: FeS-binding protein [Alteromonadaceae bacterium]|nr:FeS-binding protein [Alteromonadaceae bacterium]
MSSKIIKVGGKEITYDNDLHKSILDCLKANDVEVMYHCREGFCGACRVRKLNGEITYKLDPLAFIDDDEILPCCSTPMSDIEIKVEL